MSLKSTIDNIYKRWKDIKEYIDTRIQYASLILGKDLKILGKDLKDVDESIRSQLIEKQDKLIAGKNISIKDNVISFTPTKSSKEHVVDFTFRQRKRVKFQNRVLISDDTQEWPLFLEVGCLKNIEKEVAQVEMNIPSWFTDRDFNLFGNTYMELVLYSRDGNTIPIYRSNFYGSASCFTVETRDGQRVLLIDLTKLLDVSRFTVHMLRVFARNMKQGSNEYQKTPYILTYTPQGIKREPLYNDCDVKVMHNHFTMKVRCNKLYKGDFDMPIKRTKTYSISLVCKELIRMFEKKEMNDFLWRHLWIKVRTGNKRNTKTKNYRRWSYSYSPGYSHRSSKEWVFIPLSDINVLINKRTGTFDLNNGRQIAFTQEAWNNSSEWTQRRYKERKHGNYKNYSPISNKRGWVFYTKILQSAINQGRPERILNIREVYEDQDIFVCRKTKE